MSIEFTPDGLEIPDPTPVAIPAGFKKPDSLQDLVRRFVAVQMSAAAVDQGMESFEEANDFDVDEPDFEDRPTKYEEMADEVPIERRPRSVSKQPVGDDAVPSPDESGGKEAAGKAKLPKKAKKEVKPIQADIEDSDTD